VKARHPNGFTLIEMLVVIAIIAMLASLLAPAVGSTLLYAKTTKSLHNLRQIHQMFAIYLGNHNQQFMPSTGSGAERRDWPRVLWEDVNREFGSDVETSMQASPYSQIMWCPVQVDAYGQEQHVWGRSSYGMNAYFRPESLGGAVRFSDHPETVGGVEPLLMAGTPNPSTPRFGTSPHLISSQFPYETSGANVAYAYGSSGRNAVALWIAGNASIVDQARMIGLHDDLANADDFR